MKNRKDNKFWSNAIDTELKAIEENKTWNEVRKPEGVRIFDTKWVFTYKNIETDENDKYKARLVVRGFAEGNNIDYDDVYSPVAKMTTIRALLILGN